MRRYFLTGCTGFIGREIVRQLLEREDTSHIMCLTRQLKSEQLEHPRLNYWEGDITKCEFPNLEFHTEPHQFTDLIHGANEVNDRMQTDSGAYYRTIVDGTHRVMEWAARVGIKRTLLLSSGGVSRDTVYGRAKRMSEIICRHYCSNDHFLKSACHEVKIARIFATIGPECPLDGQYAAGIFIGQALRDKEIRFYGGTSVRTYIDVSDCARWLLKILDRGPTLQPVDVAGDTPILISDLAYKVGRVFGVPVTRVSGPEVSDSYIPDLKLAEALGLKYTTNLTQSLRRIREHYKTFLAIRHPYMEPRQGS